MDVEGEIRDLKRRVGELEGGFGFLTQQVRDGASGSVDLSKSDQRALRQGGRVPDSIRIDGRFDKVDGGSTRSKVAWTASKAD